MVLKPAKKPQEPSSYRLISLLPIFGKIFEKLFAKRLTPTIVENNLFPDYQFGFREKYSTVDQIHKITNVINKSLEPKIFCSGVFLDVSQTFDKVWHLGLVHKRKKNLSFSHVQYSTFLHSGQSVSGQVLG